MLTITMVAVTTNEIGLQRSRLPQPRRDSAEVVAVGHQRQPGEDILDIDHRIFAVNAGTRQSASRGWRSVGRRRGAR